MSLIRNGYAVSRRRGFLGMLFSALLALAVFDNGAATAQEVRQIKLTEKQIQSFMAAYEDMAKLYDDANADKPDPKVEAQAAALAKKNGFASLAQYDDVLMNITMIMSGIDPQTKKFTEPPEQIKNEIVALKADKSVSEAEKKEGLTQLEAALKNARPIQFKENIALVLKYFDQLAPIMQEHGPKVRPAEALLTALCHDNHFEDPAGHCKSLASREDFTIEAILAAYGEIISSDADDESVFYHTDPGDTPVGAIPMRQITAPGNATARDDDARSVDYSDHQRLTDR